MSTLFVGSAWDTPTGGDATNVDGDSMVSSADSLSRLGEVLDAREVLDMDDCRRLRGGL